METKMKQLMSIDIPLNENEIHLLKNMLDRLDNEIGLDDRTKSDLSLCISECIYQLSKNNQLHDSTGIL